jgi:leucyl aminopeptidase
MKIQLVTKPLSEVKTEYTVLPLFEGEKSQFNGVISDFLTDNPKFGKLFESQLLYSKNNKLLLMGAGKSQKFNFVSLQNWVGAGVKQLAKKTKQLTIVLPKSLNLTPREVGQAIAVGAEVALYDPAKGYKSGYEDPKLTTLEVVVEKADRGYQDGLTQGLIIADAVNLTRRLEDMPANEMTPTYFLDETKRIVKETKLKLTVLDEKQAAKKGMGAFVGVAQGSEEPSYMIALEYTGDAKSKEKWGLIGKGITFDTGGLNIKPDRHMLHMHYDMAGAATVLAAISAIAKLGLKVNVVAVMAVTENMVGNRPQRPGDIVKTYAGKTAEILNTDAEGRLVLIDAIAYAQKDFKANKLIDLATLTGAIIVALGDFYTGAFGNNAKFTQELIDAGASMGEKIWELPMDDEFDEMIKGDIGDLTNLGHGGSMPGAASSIAGAKFIEAGVEDNNPWVHLDIAGSATDSKGRPYRTKGATGVGVKTLVKLISS